MTDDAERQKYQEALGVAVEALQLYANEENYHAIAFLFDRPCGNFANDFNRVKDSNYNRPMPGKTARAALLKLTEKYGDLQISQVPNNE